MLLIRWQLILIGIKMKNFKRILKLSVVVLLVVLASIGMGMAGPVPVSANKRKENDNGIKIELVEAKEDDELLVELNQENQN